MGERECSVQRRHQKIIEECPSPFLVERQSEHNFLATLRGPDTYRTGLREEICASAVRLGKLVEYGSAGKYFVWTTSLLLFLMQVIPGTVEFLVDDKTTKYYFLEMNTRLQV